MGSHLSNYGSIGNKHREVDAIIKREIIIRKFVTGCTD